MIKLEGVSKRYGSYVAVNDISLEVKPGEIFGFLGVNGAGKTTTLKMIVGILKPTTGSVTIGGFDMQRDPIRAKQMTGYIPDRPYLYSKLTGREFLYFVADLYSVESKLIDPRIDTLLTDFSLLDWQDELIDSYSHGMKQRLATAAALIHDPQILIIDEPMVGLDPHGAKMFKDAMLRYSSQGKSIMLSTHSLNVAEELSDRVAILHQGRIIATGNIDEIRAMSGTSHGDLENLFLHLTANTVVQ